MLGLGLGLAMRSPASASAPVYDPATEATCTLFAKSPNYTATGATDGLWTASVGVNPAYNGAFGTSPTAVAGAPRFAAGKALSTAADTNALFTNSGTRKGTFACVVKASTAGAHNTGNPGAEDAVFSQYAIGAVGMGMSTSGVQAYNHDGGFKSLTIPFALDSVYRVCFMRFLSGSLLEFQVNGKNAAGVAGFDTLALGTVSNFNNTMLLGANAGSSSFLRGDLGAVFFSSAALDNTFAANFLAWAVATFGITP